MPANTKPTPGQKEARMGNVAGVVRWLHEQGYAVGKSKVYADTQLEQWATAQAHGQ
jgi:hypothetical protein